MNKLFSTPTETRPPKDGDPLPLYKLTGVRREPVDTMTTAQHDKAAKVFRWTCRCGHENSPPYITRGNTNDCESCGEATTIETIAAEDGTELQKLKADE